MHLTAQWRSANKVYFLTAQLGEGSIPQHERIWVENGCQPTIVTEVGGSAVSTSPKFCYFQHLWDRNALPVVAVAWCPEIVVGQCTAPNDSCMISDGPFLCADFDSLVVFSDDCRPVGSGSLPFPVPSSCISWRRSASSLLRRCDDTAWFELANNCALPGDITTPEPGPTTDLAWCVE